MKLASPPRVSPCERLMPCNRARGRRATAVRPRPTLAPPTLQTETLPRPRQPQPVTRLPRQPTRAEETRAKALGPTHRGTRKGRPPRPRPLRLRPRAKTRTVKSRSGRTRRPRRSRHLFLTQMSMSMLTQQCLPWFTDRLPRSVCCRSCRPHAVSCRSGLMVALAEAMPQIGRTPLRTPWKVTP